jgi:hypothetical protein
VQKSDGFEEGCSKLLNPLLYSHIDTLCQLAMFALLIETIFVQTVIQAFIMMAIIILAWLWAHSYQDEK